MSDFVGAVLFLGILGGIGLTFVFLFLANSAGTVEEKRPYVIIAAWSFAVALLCIGGIVLAAYYTSQSQ